jgi:hypothetical protein
MVLTLTTTHEPATDLGYLLHKNPSRIQTEELSFGKAHVFYPEAEPKRCTAAVLVEVDPVALVRGRRGVHALAAAKQALEQARDRVEGVGELLSHTDARLDSLTRYRDAYRRYCWPVSSITDLKLAPFHLLASEGKVHADKPHIWLMENLGRLCSADPQLLLATPFRQVDLNDPASCEEATAWWTEMASAGNEGMVVKPLDFITKGRRGFVQPAIKCRGPEYLKTRFNMTQEFVIGGYTPSHLGLDAIIVGVYRGKDLYFSSRVRAGFTPVTRQQVYQKIHKLETDRCPFVNLPQPPRGPLGPWDHSGSDEGNGVAKTRSCSANRLP